MVGEGGVKVCIDKNLTIYAYILQSSQNMICILPVRKRLSMVDARLANEQ